MNIITGIVCLSLSVVLDVSADARVPIVDTSCGQKAADVIFILDSSSSIWDDDFARQLEFINMVIDMFDMSPGMTQVGAISFSNWAFVDFHLNANQGKEDTKRAISAIKQIKGDTNTAAALAHLRDRMLTPDHGARLDVPHVAIVLTDGKSNEPDKTAREAERAHLYGIHMFAIGVGGAAELEELKVIGSDPDQNYVYQVANYKALLGIYDIVAIKTCEVTGLPTERPPFVPEWPESLLPTTRSPAALEGKTDFKIQAPKRLSCGEANVLDLVFATSPVANAEETDKALAFYHSVAEHLDIAEDKVRIAMVPKDCDEVSGLRLDEFDSQDEALDMLMKMQQPRTGTREVLRYMRRKSFQERNGSRILGSKKVGVLIIDDQMENLEQAYREAAKLRKKKGVKLIIIGIDSKIMPKTLMKLKGDSSGEGIFELDNYDDLPNILPRMYDAICLEDDE